MVSSPFYGWANGLQALPKRFHGEEAGVCVPDQDAEKWSVSVALDEVIPLHEVALAQWHSLAETRQMTQRYLRKADELICGLWGGRLDNEEQYLVQTELGEPPLFCLPIYVVTVGAGPDERVVYVGKTSSSHRFANGHHIALKLHHPRFDGLQKRVYRCSVLLDIHDEYVALEWVEPDTVASVLLDCVESVLIHALQPELNTAKRRKPTVGKPVFVHVQNYAGNDLLNDLMLWHKDREPLTFVPAKNMGS